MFFLYHGKYKNEIRKALTKWESYISISNTIRKTKQSKAKQKSSPLIGTKSMNKIIIILILIVI